MFGELAKAAGTAWDVAKMPAQTVLDVATKGKSVAGSLEDQIGGIDERHGLSKGWETMMGRGGGGGGGPAGPRPGLMQGSLYVDPKKGMDRPGAYRDAISDFYGGFGLEDGQLTDQYRYDPTMIDTSQLQQAEAFDFDPMRQASLEDLRGASASGLQSALSQQAAAGGLTAADRMALASSFNRSRMEGEADALSKFGIAEAENIWQTDKANRDMLNEAYLQNLVTGNEAQLTNIGTLMGQQEKLGNLAMGAFERDQQIRQAERLAGNYDPSQDPYASSALESMLGAGRANAPGPGGQFGGIAGGITGAPSLPAGGQKNTGGISAAVMPQRMGGMNPWDRDRQQQTIAR